MSGTRPIRTIVSRVAYGADDRLRAIWRIALPLVTVLVIGAGIVPASVFAVVDPGLSWRNLLSNASTVVVAIVVLVVSARYVDRRPLAAYGFDLSRRWWLQLAGGLVLGVSMLVAAHALGSLLGIVTVSEVFSAGDVESLPLGIAAFSLGWICVGLWEEIVFRGLFITNAAEGLSARSLSPTAATIGAVVFSSVVFGLLHVPTGAVPENTSLVGMTAVWTLLGGLMGLAYVLTGRLAVSIGFHIAFNFAVNNVAAVSVSDQPATPTLVRADVAGPELWHPLAGLPMLLVILVGYVILVGWWYSRGDGLAFESERPGRTLGS